MKTQIQKFKDILKTTKDQRLKDEIEKKIKVLTDQKTVTKNEYQGISSE